MENLPMIAVSAGAIILIIVGFFITIKKKDKVAGIREVLIKEEKPLSHVNLMHKLNKNMGTKIHFSDIESMLDDLEEENKIEIKYFGNRPHYKIKNWV